MKNLYFVIHSDGAAEAVRKSRAPETGEAPLFQAGTEVVLRTPCGGGDFSSVQAAAAEKKFLSLAADAMTSVGRTAQPHLVVDADEHGGLISLSFADGGDAKTAEKAVSEAKETVRAWIQARTASSTEETKPAATPATPAKPKAAPAATPAEPTSKMVSYLEAVSDLEASSAEYDAALKKWAKDFLS